MKTQRYEKRFYRGWVQAKDLCFTHIIDRETDLQILTDRPVDRGFLQDRIREYRREIENYIIRDRRFLTSLKPLAVELNAAKIVKQMSEAADKANVGPMAAVAGAVAEFLGKSLLKKGYKEVVIENGGDVFLKTRKVRRVGIYAGKSRLFRGLGLKIKPKDTPIGICTSSGTVGHSLSFGEADAAIILARSAALADAVATATANRVSSKKDLQKAVDFARSIKGVSGIVIIIKSYIISYGRVEFIK